MKLYLKGYTFPCLYIIKDFLTVTGHVYNVAHTSKGLPPHNDFVGEVILIICATKHPSSSYVD